MSRVHSATISSGYELEKLIRNEVEPIKNLDDFLRHEIMPNGVFVAHKSMLKRCRTLNFAGSEPDFIVFKRRAAKQQCHLIELKDGDNFDTKKAAAEHTSMHRFISQNAQNIPYTVHAHFCCFNQSSKDEIVRGFKDKITLEEAMTGPEFCELLELDYREIVAKRGICREGERNKEYFLSKLLEIPEVAKWLREHFC